MKRSREPSASSSSSSETSDPESEESTEKPESNVSTVYNQPASTLTKVLKTAATSAPKQKRQRTKQKPKKKAPGGQEKKKAREKVLLQEAAKSTPKIASFFGARLSSSEQKETDESATCSVDQTKETEVQLESSQLNESSSVGSEAEIAATQDIDSQPERQLGTYTETEEQEKAAGVGINTGHRGQITSFFPPIECNSSSVRHTHTEEDISDRDNSAPPRTESATDELSARVSREIFFLPLHKSKIGLETFFNFHQEQQKHVPVNNLYRSDKTLKKNLSFDEKSATFYCTICLAFCDESYVDNNLVKGYKSNTKHNNSRIEEHEKHSNHKKSVEAMLLHDKGRTLMDIISGSLLAKAKAEIAARRAVLGRLIEIAKLIGKRGLSYRGHSFESAYSLDDSSVDHGNFLELVLLLSKFDPVLKMHIEKCISESQKRKESVVQGSKGRGSLVTFLSKTFVNYIFEILYDIMMEMISEEIKEAGLFSIQIDTCQDISIKEQLSLVIRYVRNGKVHETFAGFIECTGTSGGDLMELVESFFKTHNINLENCCASATDGASNMRGHYKGFQARLAEKNQGQVHVWCYSHVLNLTMTETCSDNLIVIELFDLLNESAKFIRYSYLRINIFADFVDKKTVKRLQLIGKTRWWSKEKALSNVFGENGLYVELMLTLEKISLNEKCDSKNRSKANGICEKLKKYPLVLTAFLFIEIFSVTTPLSKYLQTKGLDVLQAQRMVETAISQLNEKKNGSTKIVFEKAADFISNANNEFEKYDTLNELNFEFPKSRGRRRKRFFDEGPEGVSNIDGQVLTQKENYTKDVIEKSFENIITLLDDRFSKHKELAADLHLLDPNNFQSLNNMHQDAFTKLAEKLKMYSPNFDFHSFKSELLSFAANWPKFNTTRCAHFL